MRDAHNIHALFVIPLFGTDHPVYIIHIFVGVVIAATVIAAILILR